MPGADPSAGPALALSSVLMSFQQMTQESFATLQRENESQRRTNETMVRASTGHFETLAKSYERTFGDLQQRYDAALRENSVLRAEIEKLKDDTKQITRMYDEVHDLKIGQSEWHQRKLKIADQLVALAPLLVAKAAKIPIDTGAVGVPGLDAFLESLDRRQIEAILSVLTPIQQGFIVQLLNVQAAKSAQASNEQGPAAAAAAAAAGGAKAPGTSSSAEQGVTG
jgi:regulator of replication initiation timing